MKAYKRIIASALLNRTAHSDIFELGVAPRILFLLFGGSGVDEEEYEHRSRSVIPVFGPLFAGLTSRGTDAVVVHVTAPYDVPFNQLAEDQSAADTWNAHVLTELLEPWSGLPYFVTGFSGGAALALNGLHDQPRCFGGAALGADAIPPGFACPAHWAGKLRLYCAPDDRVCNHPDNRRLVEGLKGRGQVEEFRLRSGGHRLADYATAGCLGELIRYAVDIAPLQGSG